MNPKEYARRSPSGLDGGPLARGSGADCGESVPDNPVTAAMQAYLRAHPHREDEVDTAFETFDPDAEDSGVEQADALPSDEPAELTATPEHQLLIEDVEWGSERDREEQWWKRL